MSDEKNNPEHSTILHLGKFAPAKAGAAQAQPEPDSSLTVSVKLAAAETVEQVGTPVLAKDSGALPPREMLGAVSYCYAKGVYTSEEIEHKMLVNPELRNAVDGEVPTADAIRGFRRLNRQAIQRTLEKAFGFLRKKNAAQVQRPLPGQQNPSPSTGAAGESTISFVRHQAADRLQEAAFVDNMSKD